MDKPVRLLVIDDSPAIHETAELLFGPASVGHAWDGREGLEKIGAFPDWDAIILDLTMPEMGGLAVLERLREDPLRAGVPVCVFSGSRADVVQALSLGARDFVDKNCDYQELKLRVMNLVEAKRRAEAAQNAKSSFLALVSHELRTPMTGVLGMAEAIRDGSLSADQSQFLDILEQSARKMSGLVDNLIQFLESENPLGRLPRVPFNPRQLVQTVVEKYALEAHRHAVSVRWMADSSVPEVVDGLPEKVSAVLDHLVGNAVKFSPGGSVAVSVEVASDTDEQVRLGFTVRDTGIGLTEDWKDKIFHPFTQVDDSDARRFGGLGLGLSIAGRLVRMLGGDLEVESGPAKGSRFHFELAFRRVASPVASS